MKVFIVGAFLVVVALVGIFAKLVLMGEEDLP